jgi:hypothetical protein
VDPVTVLDSRLTDGNEVVSLTRHPAAYPPGVFTVLISATAIVRLEGLGQQKYSVISSGIELATFRLVV